MGRSSSATCSYPFCFRYVCFCFLLVRKFRMFGGLLQFHRTFEWTICVVTKCKPGLVDIFGSVEPYFFHHLETPALRPCEVRPLADRASWWTLTGVALHRNKERSTRWGVALNFHLLFVFLCKWNILSNFFQISTANHRFFTDPMQTPVKVTNTSVYLYTQRCKVFQKVQMRCRKPSTTRQKC